MEDDVPRIVSLSEWSFPTHYHFFIILFHLMQTSGRMYRPDAISIIGSGCRQLRGPDRTYYMETCAGQAGASCSRQLVRMEIVARKMPGVG